MMRYTPIGKLYSSRPSLSSVVAYPPSNMERRSVSEIIEQYQPLLRRYENDENLIVLDAEEEIGTKPGQNYMSIVLRTKIIGKRGDGSSYTKSFMRKLVLQNLDYKKMSRGDDLFRTESHVYENLLPVLGSYGPKCVYSQPGEIILEDLGQRQFNTCERRKFFDLEHCLAVVQTMASMHAKSLSLKLNSPDTFQELIAPLNENIFVADEGPSISIHFEAGLRAALETLQRVQPQTEKIKRAIQFLQIYKDKVVSTMRGYLSPRTETDRYWVITHGDTWKNNIMFNHDEEGKIVNVKFVDFQVVRHSSAALDFTYFLYSSASQDAIERATEQMISEYERFFLHDLRRTDAPEQDLQAFTRPGWFRDELERYGLFGFFGALTVINAIFMDDARAELIEEHKTSAGTLPKTDELDISPEKTERILFSIDHFVRIFVKDM